MRVVYFLFGSSFFVLAMSATLLLTWTCWWMSTIGPSMPARRPFYKPPRSLPTLLHGNENMQQLFVYMYTLQGGWPTQNSIFRLFTSLIAVILCFTTAFKNSRRYLSIMFILIISLAFISFILDIISIAITISQCRPNSICTTLVPHFLVQQQKDNQLVCICHVQGWFYVTVLVDFILLVNASICLTIIMRPKLANAVVKNHISLNNQLSDEH